MLEILTTLAAIYRWSAFLGAIFALYRYFSRPKPEYLYITVAFLAGVVLPFFPGYMIKYLGSFGINFLVNWSPLGNAVFFAISVLPWAYFVREAMERRMVKKGKSDN